MTTPAQLADLQNGCRLLGTSLKVSEDFGGVRRVDGALGIVLLGDAGTLVTGEPGCRFQAERVRDSGDG